MRSLSLILVLTGLATSAFAQVDYVRAFDIPGRFSFTILSTSQTPISSDGTDRVPDTFSTPEYAALDVSTGTFGLPVTYPGFSVTSATKFAWVGQSPTGAYSFSVTRGLITVCSIDDTVLLGSVRISAVYNVAHSIAALSLEAPVSLLADTTHYAIDLATGVATERPLAGVDTATTRFMSYGADGLLYVLDYGNNRIASFDPANAFAPVSSFTLETGVPVTNTQFAIGKTGSFYLADGLGGGSYYNSLGQYQGVFTLPEDAELHPYTGASFINTDAEGNVLVYDSAKGLHQFLDTSVAAVPEPSTYAVAIGALLGALVLRHRWQRA